MAASPLLIARPGGMRGAIEYGQPLAGLSHAETKKQEILPTAESVSHSAKRIVQPPWVNLPRPSFSQMNPLSVLAFWSILQKEKDSAAILPLSMPYEADSAAILLVMLLYEADSDAMLQNFLPDEADQAPSLCLGAFNF